MTVMTVMKMIKDNKFYILFTLLVLFGACPILAYGLSVIIPFWKALALICTTILPAIVYAKVKSDNVYSSENFLSKELEENATQLGEVWNENEKLLGLVDEYEQLCESQLWEIPCVCGENTFVGLFSPQHENVCECDKCKNKYRITLNYESILLAEPLDNTAMFNSLKTKLESEPSSLKETI